MLSIRAYLMRSKNLFFFSIFEEVSVCIKHIRVPLSARITSASVILPQCMPDKGGAA